MRELFYRKKVSTLAAFILFLTEIHPASKAASELSYGGIPRSKKEIVRYLFLWQLEQLEYLASCLIRSFCCTALS